MREETTQHGNNGGHGGFEREDMGARPVFGFLIGLAVVGVLVYFVVGGVYRFLDRYQQAHETLQSPLRPVLETDTRDTEAAKVSESVNRTFPEPRLENDERNELNDFRLREEERLNSYGWVDQSAGTVHIPIERAMQLTVQRGLPVMPQSGIKPAAAGGKETGNGKKP